MSPDYRFSQVTKEKHILYFSIKRNNTIYDEIIHNEDEAVNPEDEVFSTPLCITSLNSKSQTLSYRVLSCVHGCINGLVHGCVLGCVNGCTNSLVHGCVHGCTNGLVHGCVLGCDHCCTNGLVHG